MFLQQIDLTTALRPSLLPDETLLFVQDAVGLYEGKYKIPNFQNGQAYLTSHRACYVDNDEPRKYSVGVELRNVDRYEYYAGFLKSSPKVTLYPKPTKQASLQIRNTLRPSRPETLIDSPARSLTASPSARANAPSPVPTRGPATWVCPICSFSNPVPSSFDPSNASALTPIAPCLACGIKPSWVVVLKAAISNASTMETPLVSEASHLPSSGTEQDSIRDDRSDSRKPFVSAAPDSAIQCPRCTFHNHPSLLACELCGAPLLSASDLRRDSLGGRLIRPESPGPSLNDSSSNGVDIPESLKFSFRGGGDKIFHERLKGAMVQRKWLLHNAPPIPKPLAQFDPALDPVVTRSSYEGPSAYKETPKTVGIAGLERRGLEMRKNNEKVISGAFEDLECLMASAKEIVALAEKFAKQSADGSSEASELLSESATALGMITTKDMLRSNGSSDSLYLSELSRNLAEYLTDDSRGILRKEGGIMSLVDLWAVFNRARGGVELVSPSDFEKATRLWEKLKLPVRLRQFRSGLLVVQRYDWNDQKTIAQLLAWTRELRLHPPPYDVQWDWASYGRGVTAQDAAERFGWSVGVASEELEMAEERGVLCREEGIEGLRFWENWIVDVDEIDDGLTQT